MWMHSKLKMRKTKGSTVSGLEVIIKKPWPWNHGAIFIVPAWNVSGLPFAQFLMMISAAPTSLIMGLIGRDF